jgi:hypothetical protein
MFAYAFAAILALTLVSFAVGWRRSLASLEAIVAAPSRLLLQCTSPRGLAYRRFCCC